ncbi:MAG: helix-turn-helix transcriptional regulator [Sulfitobacter sp.]
MAVQKPNRSPAELRNMFGSNLRTLSSQYRSISHLSQLLGINRTQFNRYLSGDSFPRPDVLARICNFFGVDARILLEPLDDISENPTPFGSSKISDFLTQATFEVPEDVFPSGFYRFSRRSFLSEGNYVRGLVQIRRDGPTTYLRGLEAKAAMRAQGLSVEPAQREFRGLVIQLEEGVAAIAARLKGKTSSVNFLNRVTSFDNNYWVGYTARTVRETPGTSRVARLVYEHLGQDFGKAMGAAREAGICALDDLLPFHQSLLQPDTPFR